MTTKKLLRATTMLAAVGIASAISPAARAADAPPAAPAVWVDTITFGAQVEAGIIGNPSSHGENYGQMFTDHANQVQLNQVLLTMTRPLDPKATDYDLGFKLQVMYGSDARYTQFVGLANLNGGDRYKADVVEANVLLHTPWLTEGGVDLKAGMYSTPLGAETIDPSTNPFYSHSYIFNMGLPLKHTGLLTTTHVNDMLDVYLGVDSGVNTTLGPYQGDNNSSYAGLGGIGLNLLGGNLTVLALTHIGPEDPGRSTPLANRYNRYYNDVVVTWKATPTLTLITEGDYVHDDNPATDRASAYGLAQYASYALTDTVALNGRAEIFVDDKNFYVAAFPGNHDFASAQAGYPSGAYTTVPFGKSTTYGAITLGVTYKPKLPAPIASLMIRPEIRYDTSLNNAKPFNDGKDSGAFTIGTDVVLAF
jgi:hypothetical protein